MRAGSIQIKEADFLTDQSREDISPKIGYNALTRDDKEIGTKKCRDTDEKKQPQ